MIYKKLINFINLITKYFHFKVSILLGLLFFNLSCSKKDPQFSLKISDALSQVGCQNVESKVYDSLYYYMLKYKELPPTSQLQNEFSSLENQNPNLKKHTEKFLKTYSFIISKIQNSVSLSKNKENKLDDTWEQIVRMELGIQDAELKAAFKELKSTVNIKNMNCTEGSLVNPPINPQPTEPSTNTTTTTLPSKPTEPNPSENISKFIHGTYWAMTTAYQSCQVLTMPALNSETPPLEGVKEIGTHPDGVGTKRIIEDLKLAQQTHPYIKDIQYDKGCFKVSESPLIYDYGGKPYVDPNAQQSLDFFKNAGSGTKVLGVDCSGFVFAALAAGGLRVAAGKNLKAPQVNGISAKMYKEPQSNGLTCFQKINVGWSAADSKESYLKPGDIIATEGHVVIIDSVGEDPFGLKTVSTVADCNQLKWSQFDFTITQSSNTKGAVGIDRFIAKDYIENNLTFQSGLSVYAKEACLAKLQKNSRTPKSTDISIVRHKGTPDCMGSTIPIVAESCISHCFSGL